MSKQDKDQEEIETPESPEEETVETVELNLDDEKQPLEEEEIKISNQ